MDAGIHEALFCFVKSGQDSERYKGKIVLSENKQLMNLELSPEYFIQGEKSDAGYFGENKRLGRNPTASVNWNTISEDCIAGTWLEDNEDWLFTAQL